MKKISRLFLGTFSALLLTALTTQAQWVYYDVKDGTYHPDAANANTYNTSTDSTTDWIGTVDGTDDWRFRNTGPGAPAADTTAYDGRRVGPDPALYTLISGLQPNTNYYVMVYAVGPRNITNDVVTSRAKYGALFSTDAGTTWTMVDTVGSPTIGPIQWVDTSGGGVGALINVDVDHPNGQPNSGDTRFRTGIGYTVATDGSGQARIDVSIPNNLTGGLLQDRFNLDGYALTIVPEPVTYGIVGLGLAALAISRRRRA